MSFMKRVREAVVSDIVIPLKPIKITKERAQPSKQAKPVGKPSGAKQPKAKAAKGGEAETRQLQGIKNLKGIRVPADATVQSIINSPLLLDIVAAFLLDLKITIGDREKFKSMLAKKLRIRI